MQLRGERKQPPQYNDTQSRALVKDLEVFYDACATADDTKSLTCSTHVSSAAVAAAVRGGVTDAAARGEEAAAGRKDVTAASSSWS